MARGTIVQRGDSWRIAVSLPKDPVTGERRRVFETVHGSKKDAEKELTKLLSQLDRNKLTLPPKATLAEYLERWLIDYASGKAATTAAYYRGIVRRYIVPHLGTVRLSQLTPAHFVRWLRLLAEQDRADGKPGKLSPQTIQHAYRTAHSALECAADWDLLPSNPLERVKAPGVPKREMRAYTVDDILKLLAAAEQEGLKWYGFFALAITSGLRQGELRGLRWQDVGLDAGLLHVQQTVARVAGVGRVIKPPKTAGSRRPIALGPDIVVLLRRHKAEQNEVRLQMGPLWQDYDLVFASEVGSPLEDKRVHSVLGRVCERAGLPKLRPYDLRHTCASVLLLAGAHPKVVSERLGHSDIRLTLSVYSHLLPGLQQEAANTLDQLLLRGKAAR